MIKIVTFLVLFHVLSISISHAHVVTGFEVDEQALVELVRKKNADLLELQMEIEEDYEEYKIANRKLRSHITSPLIALERLLLGHIYYINLSADILSSLNLESTIRDKIIEYIQRINDLKALHKILGLPFPNEQDIEDDGIVEA